MGIVRAAEGSARAQIEQISYILQSIPPYGRRFKSLVDILRVHLCRAFAADSLSYYASNRDVADKSGLGCRTVDTIHGELVHSVWIRDKECRRSRGPEFDRRGTEWRLTDPELLLFLLKHTGTVPEGWEPPTDWRTPPAQFAIFNPPGGCKDCGTGSFYGEEPDKNGVSVCKHTRVEQVPQFCSADTEGTFELNRDVWRARGGLGKAPREVLRHLTAKAQAVEELAAKVRMTVPTVLRALARLADKDLVAPFGTEGMWFAKALGGGLAKCVKLVEMRGKSFGMGRKLRMLYARQRDRLRRWWDEKLAALAAELAALDPDRLIRTLHADGSITWERGGAVLPY